MIDIQIGLYIDFDRKERYGSEWFKDDKYLYAREDIITSIVTHCRATNKKVK